MLKFDNEGLRWGFTFFRAPSYLSEGDKHELMRTATLMYLGKEDERYLKTDRYMGRIFTKRQYDVLGIFGGIRFEAELETDQGKDKMSFLVSEQTPGRGYNFSMS